MEFLEAVKEHLSVDGVMGINLPKDEMMRRARLLDDRFDFDPSLLTIASVRLDLALDPADAILLTDSFAPANHLVVAGTMPETLKR